MENNIPTAEDIFNSIAEANIWMESLNDDEKETILYAMNEHAKIHVEQALKAASEVELDYEVDYQSGIEYNSTNVQGILTAYPLNLIK